MIPPYPEEYHIYFYYLAALARNFREEAVGLDAFVSFLDWNGLSDFPPPST